MKPIWLCLYSRPYLDYKEIYISLLIYFLASLIFVWPVLIGGMLPWRPISEFSKREGVVVSIEKSGRETVFEIDGGNKFICSVSYKNFPKIFGKKITILYRRSQLSIPGYKYKAGVIIFDNAILYEANYVSENSYGWMRAVYFFFSIINFIIPVLLVFMVISSNKKGGD